MNTKAILEEDFCSQPVADKSKSEIVSHFATALTYASTEGAIAVVSDLALHQSHIFWGMLAEVLGMATGGTKESIDTIWEEVIFCRINPEDLDRKHLDELQFFHFIQKLPSAQRSQWSLHSIVRMKDANGHEHPVCHRIRYVGCEESESIRFALCLYNKVNRMNMEACLVNTFTGESTPLGSIDTHSILSDREKEVLSMIASGLRSKEIAQKLFISIHTVSRHRQNILTKLQAANSTDACRIARRLGII